MWITLVHTCLQSHQTNKIECTYVSIFLHIFFYISFYFKFSNHSYIACVFFFYWFLHFKFMSTTTFKYCLRQLSPWNHFSILNLWVGMRRFVLNERPSFQISRGTNELIKILLETVLVLYMYILSIA